MKKTPAGQTRERVFAFMRDRLLEGQPPTVREVQAAFGFRAVESAREHLQALVQEGRLLQEPSRSRGYRLQTNPRPAWVPLLGRVAAGALTTALEQVEEYVPVQVGSSVQDLFALRVSGESMIGAGILPGDILIVRRQRTASSGDIVVALVGDEATVKRLLIRGRCIDLCPANPAFEVIRVSGDQLQLLGKVIELRRSLETLPRVVRGRPTRASESLQS